MTMCMRPWYRNGKRRRTVAVATEKAKAALRYYRIEAKECHIPVVSPVLAAEMRPVSKDKSGARF
jgi:ribosomal protein S17